MTIESGAGQPISRQGRPWRSDPITRVSVLAPFALAVYIDFVQRPTFGGIFSKPPEFIGLPAAMWMQISLLAWGAVGAYVVWTTHSRLKSALGLILFSVPALFGIVLGPAIILIWQNLGSR